MKDTVKLGSILPEKTILRLRSIKAHLVFYENENELTNGDVPEQKDGENEPSPSTLDS